MGVELYIIGTSHLLQCGSAECTQSHIQVFDAEPRKLCSTLKIQRIAEEMTEDGLAHYKVNETIGQRVANDIKVSYQTVDLSIKDRSGLSLGDSEVIATVRRWAVFDGGPFREAFDDLVSVRRLCRRLDMETQLFTGTINPNMTFAQQAGCGYHQELVGNGDLQRHSRVDWADGQSSARKERGGSPYLVNTSESAEEKPPGTTVFAGSNPPR